MLVTATVEITAIYAYFIKFRHQEKWDNLN